MKRLWVRISAVAGVLAMLGGGGYFFMGRGNAETNASNDGTEVASNAGDNTSKQVTPLKDQGLDESSSYGAVPANYTGDGAYVESSSPPAVANWKDQTGKPMVQPASNNQLESQDGSGSYQLNDAPPVDPSSAYGNDPTIAGTPYDPSRPYGDTADQTEGSPRYGETIGDGAIATQAYDATDPVSAGPIGGGSPGAAPPAYGNEPSGYGADSTDYGAPSVVAPPVARQEFDQPVTAPSFADGQAVGPGIPPTDLPPSGNRAPDDRAYGDTRELAVADAGPANGQSTASEPQFDGSPAPRFDASPAAPPERMVSPAYSTTPSNEAPPAYAPAAAVAAGSSALAAAVPGARSLDGLQTPSISVEKSAPAEVQVGKPASFKTLVRNVGQVTAKNVVITDRPPQGTRFIDATPQPSQTPDGSLTWQFESLGPGEEVLISMQVLPEVEGELGTTAQLTFQTQASVRTICTKPQLLVEHKTSPKALIGEDVVFEITISNPGSGDATGIVLEEDVPRGLTHFGGAELENEIGTLRPNESLRLELVLKAAEAGIVTNKLRVRGDGNLVAEHSTKLEVIAPKLLVGMSGPRRRYLEREVTYQVAFGNAGTAIARNVELATYLPKGLQFISTSGKGQYDARDHAVYWSLDQLVPGQEGSVDLTALPIEAGEQKLRIEGTADLGLSHKYEHLTVVEAITELVFSVSDTHDPIEVGSETVFVIKVANNGSKTATNVQLAAILPAELTPLNGDGPTRVAIQGQQVVMEPIERFGPRDEAVYKIKVQGQRAGDHIIDVRLVSDEVPTPVTKQESTKVYADGL